MKKAICIPFAFDTNKNSGVNISHQSQVLMCYLQNACVALVSAKKYNPEAEVMLVTNINEQSIPQEITSVLSKYDVRIQVIAFDQFLFPDHYRWSLAFYKLCALHHLVEMEYDAICYLDTDVIIQGSFDAIWEEIDNYIMLYDINHGLNTKEYVEICAEFSTYYGKKTHITHYGGEFFCANLENAKLFIQNAHLVYRNMIEGEFQTNKGDEFIVSIVADNMKALVKNASPYICRFWTGVRFRLVSDCYRNNPVVVLHLPAEKERGMVKIFRRYVLNTGLPEKEVIWSICRLSKQPLTDRLAQILLRINR